MLHLIRGDELLDNSVKEHYRRMREIKGSKVLAEMFFRNMDIEEMFKQYT